MQMLDAQIEGLGGGEESSARGQRTRNMSNRRTREQNKDLESMFLDDEGDRRPLKLVTDARADLTSSLVQNLYVLIVHPFLWEGVAKRRELLLQMLKDERTRRREDGAAVSSSDEERDMRRVDAQIEGLGGRGIALSQRTRHTSYRRTREQNKDLESMFLDDEGDDRLLNRCVDARAVQRTIRMPAWT